MAAASPDTAFARDIGDGWARLVRGAVHGEVLLQPGGSLGIGGEAFGEMNWADVYGLDGAAAVGALRAFTERLRERGLPGMISATSAVAGAVAEAAAELGLRPDPLAMPLMACVADLARPVRSRHRGERVTDQTLVPRVAEVLGEAFGCPAWMCLNMLGPDFALLPEVDFFVAPIDGEMAAVVGTARVGSTVGIYAVGTRPALRRQGAASVALSAAVEYHRERGAVAFGLHASAAGAPLYERLGFAVVDPGAGWYVDAD
jgi:GNAT superfamily N-acetyltransferase